MSSGLAIKAITRRGVDRALDELEEAASARPSRRPRQTSVVITLNYDTFMERALRHAVPLDEVPAEDAAEPVLLIIDNVDQLPVEAVAALLSAASNRQRFSDLVEVLTPPHVPPPATVEQARRNAEARVEFLGEFPTLSSGEVADLAGSRSRNRAALAHGWRKQDRVFSVSVGREQRYPVFQFDMDVGTPKANVSKVISLLRSAGLEGWQIALWFTGPLARLGDRRPVDVVDTEPDQVVEAAGAVQDIPF
jgi:hypothetical protein